MSYNARAGPSRQYPKPPAPDSESDSESSDSTDVTEDSDGEELTPALDAAILRTLAKIKRGEGVYGDENVLANELKEAEEKAGKLGLGRGRTGKGQGTTKPFLLSDHHRNALLRPDEVDPTVPLTYVQNERRLREEAVDAFKNFGGVDDDDEEEDVLEVKKKGVVADQDEGDGDEYRRFMLEMGGGEDEVRKVLGIESTGRGVLASDEEEGSTDAVPVKKKKKSRRAKKVEVGEVIKAKKAKADDDFLMNYILNRGWIDQTTEQIPTYDEIIGADNNGKAELEDGDEAEDGADHPWGVLDEDDFDEKAEEFETAYNFRFEEPGAANILTHPRSIPTLVRRPDDTRSSKRAAKAERKAAERAAQEEELRRQKGEKRREMEKGLRELKAEFGGVEGLDWTEVEELMEGDWEEERWDEVVGRLVARAAEAEGDGKPDWEDGLEDVQYEELSMDEGADEEEWGRGPYGDEGEEAEEAPIYMDADFPEDQPKKKKNRKSKKGKGKVVEEDTTDLTVEEKAEKVKAAMKAYQSLDHEDMIGDLPTRFKYTRAQPTSLGLTPVEILLATDAELNALASVKHLAPYRRGGLGRIGQGLNKRIRDLKTDLRGRKWGEEEGQSGSAEGKGRVGSGANDVKLGNGGERKGKRVGRKERMKAKVGEVLDGVVREIEASEGGGAGAKKREREEGEVVEGEAGEGEAKKRRKKKKKNGVVGGGTAGSVVP